MQDHVVRLVVEAAKKYDVRPSALLALVEIETRGVPFEPDGVTPRFLFERHIFYRECAKKGSAVLAAAVAQGLAIPGWNRATQYRDQGTPAGRAALMARARAVDAEAANASASHGIPQVMGFNHRIVGYTSATDMVNAMTGNVEAQIEIFMRFLQKSNILQPLRNLDWHTVARLYNGASYAQNGYHRLLPAAFNKYAPIYGLLGFGKPQERAEEILARELDPVELQTANDKWDTSYGKISKRATPPEQELPHDQIVFIQQRLRDLGYFEVGEPNGEWGTRTTGAISAFQAHEHLRITGSLDAQTKARLEIALPRPASADRQMATAATLHDSRTIKTASRVGLFGKAQVAIGTALGLDQMEGGTLSTWLYEMQSKVSGLKYAWQQITAFAGGNKFLIAVIAGVLCIVLARKFIAYRVDDHKSGAHSGTCA